MYKNILFPIDINDENSWKVALDKVAELCSMHEDSKLTIMNVVQTYGLGVLEEYFPKGWAKEVSKKSTQMIEKIVKENFPSDINFSIIVDRGVVYQEILSRAEKDNVDLIVMSAHHPNRSDYLLGPNVAKVVRHAKVSVLVVRE